jgi:hypothetical protein
MADTRAVVGLCGWKRGEFVFGVVVFDFMLGLSSCIHPLPFDYIIACRHDAKAGAGK